MKKKPLYSFHVSSIFFGFTVIRKTTKDVSVMEPGFQKGKGGGDGGSDTCKKSKHLSYMKLHYGGKGVGPPLNQPICIST